MPYHDYHCAECGLMLERYYKKAPPKTKCPRCGGIANKQISNLNIIFKGPGFTKSKT